MYLFEVAPLSSIPRPNPQILTYFASEKLSVGCLIMVPLFKRQAPALVLNLKKVSQQKIQIKQADYLMRSLTSVINKEPLLPLVQIKLALWLSQYYWASLGRILKSMLPLAKYLDRVPLFLPLPLEGEGHERKIRPILVLEKDYSLILEKYSGLLKSTLNTQHSAIILVPEVRQLKEWQEVLARDFPEQTIIIHSKLSPKQYFETWLKIRQNKAKIILGTRLAILMPMTNLGLIIINQEHSPYYKSSEQKPYLQARDAALKLGQLTGAQVILSSAIPSLESYHLVGSGRDPAVLQTPVYYHQSPTHRDTPRRVSMKIVDLRQEIKTGNFSMLSRQLQSQLADILKQKKQALLFINRKGLASALLCRDCGKTINCPGCSLPLVYHQTSLCHSRADDCHSRVDDCHSRVGGNPKAPLPSSGIDSRLRGNDKEERMEGGNDKEERRNDIKDNRDDNTLLCHHCGWQRAVPQECPHCHSYWLKPVGGGTQKLMAQVKQLLPQGRLAIFDKDHAPKLQDEKIILKNWLAKKIDILISTSLIFNLESEFKTDFIGVVNIDRNLNLPDFRSSERTWQMLKRLQCLLFISSPLIRGRVGVGDDFLIQTYNPQNYVLEAIVQNNDQFFYQKEIQARVRFFYPPFSHLVKLSFKHRDATQARQQAQTLKAKLVYATQKVSDKIKILGPAPGFIPKIKNQFVWQIILKVHPCLMPKLSLLLGFIPSQWSIDIDPESLL